MIGWIGSALLFYGSWNVGNKQRWAFLVGLAGEVIWTYVAWDRRQWDLFWICVSFDALYLRNFYAWGRETKRPSSERGL